MQRIGAVVGEDIRFIDLPAQDEEVLPGVRWGDAGLLLTPAWIAKHAHMRRMLGEFEGLFEPRRRPLVEDVVFCLLGGFGIKAELATAAYHALRLAGLFTSHLTASGILAELKRPLDVDGRQVRYRFPNGRARYIDGAMRYLERTEPPSQAIALRNYLLGIPGVGQKTASYIVRNHLGADDVAILDIHVVRAGQIACMFPESVRLPRDYGKLEDIFLAFARAADVSAACLDLTIWTIMRGLSPSVKAAAERLNKTHLLAGGGPPIYVDRLLWAQGDLGRPA
jgi:thermostable 8-oxoguanine DNA glycosylase